MLHEHVATALKNHRLYAEFVQVKNQLQQHNCVCWIAGGAVRDFLLGRTPADLDLVTDATTTQILTLFPAAIPVGLQFGVVKLSLATGDIFDLATFRRESDYVDGRRPSHVDFATPCEDARRRDFTVNALFWDDTGQCVVDYADGVSDINARVLRCVGDPTVRFQEDHLRVLRLLRFHIQLGFTIESATLGAALGRVQDLKKISGERIWSEFQKMIPHIQWDNFIHNLLALKVLHEILPLKTNLSQKDDHGISVTGAEFSKIAFFNFLVRAATSVPQMRLRLRDRLRISKSDMKIFDSVSFCNANIFSSEEWVFEAENNILILDILKFYYVVKAATAPDWPQIDTLFRMRPPKVVNGHDLVGLVPVEKTGEVLKKIRLLQLKQPELDKQKLLKLI